MGFLLSNGMKIQRARVHGSMLRIDPYGMQRRLRRVLHRRKYSVPMPNSLWHLDGNHKLIRWKIVVHAAIDGFSRLPVFFCELLTIIELTLFLMGSLKLFKYLVYPLVRGVIKEGEM